MTPALWVLLIWWGCGNALFLSLVLWAFWPDLMKRLKAKP